MMETNGAPPSQPFNLEHILDEALACSTSCAWQRDAETIEEFGLSGIRAG
jgi:hypothetical protein